MLSKKLPICFKDKYLLLIFSLLILICIISIILQISAGNGAFSKFALPQLIKMLLGLLSFFVIYSFNTTFIFSLVEIIYLLCLLLVIFVEILGTTRLGAQRWLHIGLVMVQPSEFMKIAIVLLLAKTLQKIPLGQEGKITNYFFPMLWLIIPTLLIIVQPDLGTACIIISSAIAMFFIAGLKIRYFIIATVITLIATPIMWFNLYNYQKERILIFLDPNKDPLGSGYHTIQSKIAIGSGGLIGKGFLQGTQSQLNFIPEKHTDFVFSLLTEEFGFVGAIVLLILYTLIIYCCFILAFRAVDNFAKLTIVGLNFIFFIQIFFNIGMVTGILPVVGIPLPLVSYGGTSIITTFAMFSLILNLNKKVTD